MPRMVNSENPPKRIPMVVGADYRITYPDSRQPEVLTYQGHLAFDHLYFTDNAGHKVVVEPNTRMQKISKGGSRRTRRRLKRSRKH